MIHQSTPKIAIVVPNWNGEQELPACLDSLRSQSMNSSIIVVENGSVDGSVELLESEYPDVTLLKQPKNLGFAGGVNIGIRYALDHEFDYVALFNNDAVADKEWLKYLVNTLEKSPNTGIATCKFLNIDGSSIDSTGDMYTVWGLPYPRGRGEKNNTIYNKDVYIFGASGGATIYRSELLRKIGLFDEKFFAYYEDIDVSFRAQLSGWKVQYVSTAIAYHRIGATSNKIRGFTTYQTMKNLPMLFWKNTPLRYTPIMFPRLFFAYWLMVLSAITKGNGMAALKGNAMFLLYLPHVFSERKRIQRSKTVTDAYIWSIITHDLPPNATKLRAIRNKLWKLLRKSA